MIEIGWGKRLARARGSDKQEDVALCFGTRKATVSSYETEKTAPDLKFLIRFAQRYGVSLDWLATGIEKPPTPITVEDVSTIEGIIEALAAETPQIDAETRRKLIATLYNNRKTSSKPEGRDEALNSEVSASGETGKKAS